VTVVQEGQLEFRFNASWEAERWDGSAAHKNMQAAFAASAVDIVGLRDNDEVFLFEVKDYRKSPRHKDTPIAEEIARKAADTLAGLVAECRRDGTNDLWSRTGAILPNRGQLINVVLWLEQGRFAGGLGGRAGRAAIADDLRRRCRRLGFNRAMLFERAAQTDSALRGVHVKSLPAPSSR
jgi:hypothetical protein